MISYRRRDRGTTANCREVMRVLQLYLDGHTDPVTTTRVERHLEVCRHCDLEAAIYEGIKAALARRAPRPDRKTVESLRAFGAALSNDGAGEASPGRRPPSF
jgi:anti-sigma factor (TIGR02949 family)